MKRFLISAALCLAATGCVTTSTPYSSNLGGKKIAAPPVENFRGRPVIQISFIANASSGAESAFLNDYVAYPLGNSSADSSEDDGLGGTSAAGGGNIDYAAAEDNMKAMFTKNIFYTFHLAQFMKLKSGGEVAVILNPMTLNHSVTEGYSLEPFEKNMPPADVEISFLSYVHPETRPSNKGSLLTTFGESLAPIVSIRVDPVFNPDTRGAVALTEKLASIAHDPHGRGLRAQFVDYLNAKKYGALQRHQGLTVAEAERAVTSGDFKPGHYFSLDLGSFDLTTDPVPDNVIPASDLGGRNYVSPGNYSPYLLYNAWYKIAMSALAHVDNNKAVTEAQKKYWATYEPNDISSIMLGQDDRRKRRFLMRARQTEVKYLEDRDTNWINGVFNTNNFSDNFGALRDAEQAARNEYVNAQARAALGALLAIGGVALAASNSNNNSFQSAGSSAAMVAGIAVISDAMSKLGTVDSSFSFAFGNSYASQKSYVFEAAQGEKVEVRAVDYADFKKQLQQRYFERFRRGSVVVPGT